MSETIRTGSRLTGSVKFFGPGGYTDTIGLPNGRTPREGILIRFPNHGGNVPEGWTYEAVEYPLPKPGNSTRRFDDEN